MSLINLLLVLFTCLCFFLLFFVFLASATTLLYGLEASPLRKADLNVLDFVVNNLIGSL